MSAGRTCPLHYAYSPSVFARRPDLADDAIYVVGGLYGNGDALDAVEAIAADEPAAPRLVFNGDFHWLDVDEPLFTQVQARVLGHTALRGNVETELASRDDDAGCGCAYPDAVPDDEVERSNEILRRLRSVARAVPQAIERLADLPMHAVAQIGNLRVAIVHGDAWSLAGWRFAHDSVHDPANESALVAAFRTANVDGFACSHTGAAALKLFGSRFVVNNGSAGMANFAGDASGLLTRIAVRPLPASLVPLRAYGVQLNGTHIDALRIELDVERWLRRFDAMWPPGSPAAVSYRRRIAFGPSFDAERALGRPASGS